MPEILERKAPAAKWFPFHDVCTLNSHFSNIIGFMQFGQVMYDLWHFVNNCHSQGIRIGNLRPWDLQFSILKKYDERTEKKINTYKFSLIFPDSAAIVGNSEKMEKFYGYLDPQYIHPEYFPKLSIDDQARLDQDWYAYSVLCYWFVTKHDPFGEGVVKAKPDADRIYRMEKVILNQSSKVKLDEKKDKFIQRAIGRLSPEITRFIKEFIEREFVNKDPQFVLSEFKDEKVIACSASIRKGNKKTTCGFKQLDGFNTCRYCGAEHVKMTISRNAIF